MRSHSTSTAGTRLALLVFQRLSLCRLAYPYGSPLVDLPIGAPVLETGDGSAPATSLLVASLVHALVLLIHQLFDCLLADAVVAEVVELF